MTRISSASTSTCVMERDRKAVQSLGGGQKVCATLSGFYDSQ